MISIKEWMELVDFRITEGGDYGWMCFGPNAYSLSSWNGEQDGYSFNIVFDTKNQTVYTVEVCDYTNNRAYRIINPLFKEAHDSEAGDRSVLSNQAWDDVNWIDLEEDDDFIQKGLSIKAGEDYDTRINVPLELSDDVLFELMKLAHEKDKTLNQFVEDLLREEILRIENGAELFSNYELSDLPKFKPHKKKSKGNKKK
jgi:hypothetical protein